MPEFRPKKILPKVKKYVFERLTDPGNPYTKPKKPVIELNKAFSVVMDQRMFAEARMVLKRLRSSTNPHRIRTSETLPNKKVIKAAESTKPTKAYAKMVRAVNKPKASILESLSKTTGLPSLEKKAAQARELTTQTGSSKEAVQKVGNMMETKKKVGRIIENPGKAVVKGTETFVENPITTTGFVLGKFQLASPKPEIVAFPTFAVSAASEKGIKEIFPGYNKATSWLKNKFHGSKLSNGMEKGVNYAVEFGKNVGKYVIA